MFSAAETIVQRKNKDDNANTAVINNDTDGAFCTMNAERKKKSFEIKPPS